MAVRLNGFSCAGGETASPARATQSHEKGEDGVTTLREEPADRDLVRRAKAGDPGAFDQIWRLYWTPVYVTALSVLHHDKDAANDAAAEVFAGLLGGGLSGFDESRPLLPLLRTIATRRAADEVRRRSRRVSVSYTAEVPDVPTDDLVCSPTTTNAGCSRCGCWRPRAG